MKKRAILINFFVALSLLLMAAIVPSSLGAYAQPAAPEAPEAVDVMPPPIIQFPGIFRETPNDWSTDPDAILPDTSGAAGHTHFLQAANKTLALYRKNGDLIASSSFDDFWLNAGTNTLCDAGAGSHHGQPYVMYDHMASRWVVVDVAYTDVDNGPYYMCVAVSNGVAAPAVPGVYFDPTHWKYFALLTSEGQMNLYPDSPKLGLWPDGYYLSADVYDVFNNGMNKTPRGAKVWALNRDDLTSPSVSVIRYIPFYLNESTNYEHLVPSNLLGYPPPTGTPNYFASIQQGKFHIWEFRANWLTPSNSTFGTPTKEPNRTLNTDTSSSWASGYIIPQPPSLGAAEQLNVMGDRLMSPLQYRIVDNTPSLWATHALLSGGVVGMRWYEMQFATDGSPYFYQIGTYQPDTNYRWLGSLAVDRMGDMALGFSISNPITLNPSIYYAGRLKGDPLNQLSQGENVLYPRPLGVLTGPQLDNDAVFDGPWGRQSQMSVDPLDECVFWYTNMYYDPAQDVTNTNWRTRIGWFSFPECRGGALNRVSLHTNGTQGNDASGVDFEMYSTAISANGRFVAFSSEATTLVTGDTNNVRDIFLARS